MSPLEFVLWMNGAAGMVGDGPPTAEQWVRIREELEKAVGKAVATQITALAGPTKRAASLAELLEEDEVARAAHNYRSMFVSTHKTGE